MNQGAAVEGLVGSAAVSAECGANTERQEVQMSGSVANKAEFKTQNVPVTYITADSELLCREHVNEKKVERYAQLMSEGAQFPPVDVFNDGNAYYLADGFHRLAAMKSMPYTSAVVRVFNGSKREALLHAIKANSNHGSLRTKAESKLCIVRLLQDPEWSQWSNREIARIVGVNEKTVRNNRATICGKSADTVSRKVKRNGTVYEQKIATSKTGPIHQAPTPEALQKLAGHLLTASQSAEHCGFAALHWRLKRVSKEIEKKLHRMRTAAVDKAA